jgi:hypothetical protein
LADSYIKAEDPANFAEVIEISNRAGKHDDLVRFLQMARKPLREPRIDMELAYAYAGGLMRILLRPFPIDFERLDHFVT